MRAALAPLLCLVFAVQVAHGIESSYEPDFSPMRKEAARLHEEGNKPWKTHNMREKENSRPDQQDNRPAEPNNKIDTSQVKSARQGDAAAQHSADTMPAQDVSVSHDDAETVLRLTQAAEQGDAHAQCVLGTMYTLGQGVPQNDAKALQLYEKAAENKNAEAQYALAWIYAQGRGVPRDEAKAVQWCRKAAKQGFVAYSSCQQLRGAAKRSVK